VDPDPGGQKTRGSGFGSGSGTLLKRKKQLVFKELNALSVSVPHEDLGNNNINTANKIFFNCELYNFLIIFLVLKSRDK
jgi:hypothetical protein